uniref:Isoprenylcysteine carboxylmethyltransferase family protein n=1 Tax=Acidobacterium capsulatum TaxID=33075 RepID=A0A7V5CTL9_9BACT
MRWVYDYLFIVMWVAFLLYWRIAAVGAKATQRIEPARSRALRVVLFACALLLLIAHRLPLPWLYDPFYRSGLVTFWLGAAITMAGLLFCVWARLHLGANWSRSVTIKQGHELITTGPYRIVRHPIYTGLLTGFLGTAIALGQVRGAIAFLLILVAFRFKWRLEEQWMREQFGPLYADYARRVPSVLPRPM